MQCAISGEVPKEPVVSIKSGYIFEKSLIEKYVSANKKCPITGEPLSEEDLLPLKGNTAPVKPRVPAATSIPGLIQLFQNEWEASTLETYTLKQQLDAAKQELAHTLYRYDAACRVIARLTKERDEARQLLSSSAKSTSLKRKRETEEAEADDNKSLGEEDPKKATVSDVMPPSVVAQVSEASEKLIASRKGRKKPAELAGEDDFAEYAQSLSIPLHSSSMPGIKKVDLFGTRVLTGGVDGSLILSDLKTANDSKTVFAGHSKPISSLAFHPRKDGVFFSAASDGLIKVWSMHNKSKPRHTLTNGLNGNSPVTFSLHPALDVLLSGGARSRAWSLWDVEAGLEIVRAGAGAAEEAATAPIMAAKFHPDGRIMAHGGEDGVVRFWDSTSSALVKNAEGHKSKITDIAFSNNGYQVASSSSDGEVKVWDIRHLDKSPLSAVHEDSVSAIAYDDFGAYLGVCAGSDVHIYHVRKAIARKATLPDHTAAATGVRFGPNARYVVSAGMDCMVRVFGKIDV